MNETRTINLNGLVYHIDYDAYKLLHDYLQDIELRLPQEDRKEVMADIEARIAELFQNALFAKKVQVINVQMFQSVKSQIGEPSEFGPNSRPKVKVDKSQNAGCGRIFSIVLNVVLAIFALPIIVVVMLVLFALLMSFLGVAAAGTTSLAAIYPIITIFPEMLVEGGIVLIPVLVLALILIVVLPVVMVVHTIITYMRTRRGPKARFWWITIVLWLLSIIALGVSFVKVYRAYEDAPEILQHMMFEDIDIDDEGAVTTPLSLSAFHSIEIKGAANLHISQSENAALTRLTTNWQHVFEDGHLQTDVRDSVLYITTNNTSVRPLLVEFHIALPELRKLTVYGAAEVETEDNHWITTPTLELDLNGAAKVDLQLNVQMLTIDAKGASKLELEGAAEDVNVTIAGAGELDAEALVAQNMHITCAGASKAELHVVKELWAQAAGASKITYEGNPIIKQKMAVGGSVIRRD